MVIKNAFLIFLVMLLIWCEYVLTFNNPYHNRHYYPIHLLSNILVFILNTPINQYFIAASSTTSSLPKSKKILRKVFVEQIKLI